jgi:hypothetical protein
MPVAAVRFLGCLESSWTPHLALSLDAAAEDQL